MRAKAQVRLLYAADKLMAALLTIAQDESVPVPVRLVAIRDGLDRAGLGAKQQVEIAGSVELSGWEQNATKVARVVHEEYIALPAGYEDLDEDDEVRQQENELAEHLLAMSEGTVEVVPATPPPLARRDPAARAAAARTAKAEEQERINAAVEARIQARLNPPKLRRLPPRKRT